LGRHRRLLLATLPALLCAIVQHCCRLALEAREAAAAATRTAPGRTLAPAAAAADDGASEAASWPSASVLCPGDWELLGVPPALVPVLEHACTTTTTRPAAPAPPGELLDGGDDEGGSGGGGCGLPATDAARGAPAAATTTATPTTPTDMERFLLWWALTGTPWPARVADAQSAPLIHALGCVFDATVVPAARARPLALTWLAWAEHAVRGAADVVRGTRAAG
jgi:hypothetical protein